MKKERQETETDTEKFQRCDLPICLASKREVWLVDCCFIFVVVVVVVFFFASGNVAEKIFDFNVCIYGYINMSMCLPFVGFGYLGTQP